MRIRVLKNRHTGETGVAGYLRYDKETDRLEACKKPKREEANPFTKEGEDIEKGDF